MIRYHYNLLIDIKAQLKVLRELSWLKKEGIKAFYPNPWETLKLIIKRPKINYQCEGNIECYWVSGGVWGSYYLPDKIHICPRKATPNFIERTIKHEITHLKYEKDVQNMSHQDKEAYIESKENSW